MITRPAPVCPECGAAIYQNRQELHTVVIDRLDAQGRPIRGDDDCVMETAVYSYNCSGCAVEWESWDILVADLSS